MGDPGLREDAFGRSAADFRRSSAVLRARVVECRRMLTQVAESKRSSDDLNDLRTFFGRPNLPRSAGDRCF